MLDVLLKINVERSEHNDSNVTSRSLVCSRSRAQIPTWQRSLLLTVPLLGTSPISRERADNSRYSSKRSDQEGCVHSVNRHATVLSTKCQMPHASFQPGEEISEASDVQSVVWMPPTACWTVLDCWVTYLMEGPWATSFSAMTLWSRSRIYKRACGYVWPRLLLSLVTRPAWVNFEFSIVCVHVLRSFPLLPSLLNMRSWLLWKPESNMNYLRQVRATLSCDQ